MLNDQASNMADAASISVEMQGYVHRAAEPWIAGDTVKAGLLRASRQTGLQYRRVRTLWYRQTLAISAFEADTLRAWNRRWLASQKARLQARLEQMEMEWQATGGADE